jgi:hypothetical protein
MFVIGLGLGLVMQVLVVAVQNSVPHARLGTATSTATFFRTIGGAIGVAALGAVFDTRLLSQLKQVSRHLTSSQRVQLHRVLQGGAISSNPRQIQRLPAAVRIPLIDAFSHALQLVFEVAVPFAIVAFAMCFLLKETPLRTTAFVTTNAKGESADDVAEMPSL